MNRQEHWRNGLALADNQILALINICAGLSCDNQLNDIEISFLQTWLTENRHITNDWPGNIISARLNQIFSDGKITSQERTDLLSVLKDLSGVNFTQTGYAQADSPATLEILSDDEIDYEGSTFCFTGVFTFGKRHECIRIVEKRGGIILSNVTEDLDYLIVGTHTTNSWKYGSFGSKVEKAAALKKRIGRPLIMTEEHWVQSL